MKYCNCGQSGEYFDSFAPHSQNFCSTCFTSYLEKKMLRGFPRVTRGHSLAVAVSGGKDSTVLLNVILKHQKELKIPSVKAIFLEEQIPNLQIQRQQFIDVLQNKYPELQILYRDYSEIYGYSLPELVKKSNFKNLRFTPCMICGILKKNALFKIVRELKTPFIALGTTLEDEASTILLNVIRGRLKANLNELNTDFLSIEVCNPQLLKPFARISENLIRMYMKINNLPMIATTCSYANQSIRSDLKPLMENLKKRDPRGSLLFNITKLKQTPSYQKANNSNCMRCQTPSNQSLCSACRILAKIA